MKFEITRPDSAPFNRATGSTFRLMLQALIDASSGKDVLLVYGTRSMVEYAQRKVGDMCYAYFRDDFTRSGSPGNFEIRFPKGGRLSMTTRRDLYHRDRQREEMVRSGRLLAIWDLKDEPLPQRPRRSEPKPIELANGPGPFPYFR